MKVSLNFEFDSNEAAEAFLRQVRERAAQITEPDAPAETPKRQRKKAAPVAPDPGPAQAPKLEDVQAQVEKVFEKYGMQTTMDLLSRHGVKKVRDLKPEQYADFIAAAEEVIAGKDPAAIS